MTPFARYYKPAVTVRLGADQFIRNDGNDGLRITFRVSRTLGVTPDSAQVVIYNLSAANRSKILRGFSDLGQKKIAIAAGYDGVIMDLFSGDIRSLKSAIRRGADIATDIVADDAGDLFSDVPLNSISSAGRTPGEMIDLALRAFRLFGDAITKHTSVDAVVNAHIEARSLFSSVPIGKATDLINEAARILQARWWIRDSQLFFASRFAPTSGKAVVLDSTRMLSEPAEDGEGLTWINAFMDPNIIPGEQVQLRERVTLSNGQSVQKLSGSFYRVEATQHAGDTHSGPWSVAAALRRLDSV
jgi:hypothetical protein